MAPALAARRRALAFGYEGEHFTLEEWLALLEFYGHRCLRCGTPNVFHRKAEGIVTTRRRCRWPSRVSSRPDDSPPQSKEETSDGNENSGAGGLSSRVVPAPALARDQDGLLCRA